MDRDAIVHLLILVTKTVILKAQDYLIFPRIIIFGRKAFLDKTKE